MQISKCLHPVRVMRPDKTFNYVPCGKCEACRSLKAYQWKKRLDSEMSSNVYTMAITLTYDQRSLPTITLHSDRTITYNFLESKREFSVPLDVYQDLSNYPDIYKIRRDGNYIIPVVSHTDLQTFIKNLKFYAPSIRWFIQSELGPTTLRPHYHGLLFFSEYEPEYIKASILKAWPKCDWTVREHQDSLHLTTSSSYSTSYVASVLSLPKIHNYGRFATFHYSSNRPPIGSLSYSSEDIKQYERGEALSVARYDIRNNAYESVPFLRHLQDKCFGQLPNYSLLSPATGKFLLMSYQYFGTKRYERSIGKLCFGAKFSDYAERFSRFLELSPELFDKFSDVFTSESSMYRVYRVSKQYVLSCAKTSPLFVDYAFDTHYYQLEMAKLRQQYQYEEDFCNRRKMSPRWLIFKDLEFIHTYQNAFGIVPDWVDSTLETYGFDGIDDFCSNYENYVLSNNVDCKAYFNRIHKILHESHKTKANRSYTRKPVYDSLVSLDVLERNTDAFPDSNQQFYCPF